MTQTLKNLEAVKKTLETYHIPEGFHALKQLFDKSFPHPADTIGTLRFYGLRCIGCSHDSITGPILRWFNYQADQAKCYECQKNNR